MQQDFTVVSTDIFRQQNISLLKCRSEEANHRRYKDTVCFIVSRERQKGKVCMNPKRNRGWE